MANKLPSTNLEQFLNGFNLRLRVNSAKYIALIVPNWPKWQSLNPYNFTKKSQIHIVSNLSPGQQNLLNDAEKNSSKMAR